MTATKQRTAPLLGLKAKRIFRGMNQAEAGAAIGVTQSHYRQFEEGIIRLDIQRAKKLADMLECSIEELM